MSDGQELRISFVTDDPADLWENITPVSPEDFAPPGMFVVPEAGYYSINGGEPVLLTDDEVREMGFEPP